MRNWFALIVGVVVGVGCVASLVGVGEREIQRIYWKGFIAGGNDGTHETLCSMKSEGNLPNTIIIVGACTGGSHVVLPSAIEILTKYPEANRVK